jgi:HEAT repeats
MRLTCLGRRLVPYAGLLICSLIVGAKTAGASALYQGPVTGLMKIRVEGDHVTADIRDALLQSVLEELAAQTGVVFEIPIQVNPPVSVSLYRVTIQDAIQRIVSGNNAFFYYESGESTGSRIQLVRIFARGKGEASLRYIGTGAPTKRAEDALETPEQALKALEESTDLEKRQKAVEMLVLAKGEAAIQGLMKALRDPAVEVRVAAIEGLAAMGVRSALPQFQQALKDSHPGVRLSAVQAIALLGDANNVKDLDPLAHDKDGSVAAAAQIAIRKLSGAKP